MSITLTWDLFIIVFTAIVITYSFIIGRKESVKIIIATYIAVVAVQGIGNVFKRALGEAAPLLSTLGIGTDATLASVLKLVLFVAVVIALAIRSGISVQYPKEPPFPVQIIFTIVFGFATAGLLLSTILTYVSGVPLLDTTLPTVSTLSPILQASPLMQLMIVNQDVWFALPAVALLAAGVMGNRS